MKYPAILFSLLLSSNALAVKLIDCPKSARAGFIVLKSTENKCVELKSDVAKQSVEIKTMIADAGTERTPIALPDMDNARLQNIATAMNDSDVVLTINLSSNKYNVIQILNAAWSLNVARVMDEGFDAFARKIFEDDLPKLAKWKPDTYASYKKETLQSLKDADLELNLIKTQSWRFPKTRKEEFSLDFNHLSIPAAQVILFAREKKLKAEQLPRHLRADLNEQDVKYLSDEVSPGYVSFRRASTTRKMNRIIYQMSKTDPSKINPSGDVRNLHKYSGPLGNEYFQLYKNEVVLPNLIVYFKFLQSHPDLITATRFAYLIHMIGDERHKIAEDTQSPDAEAFGRPTDQWTRLMGLQEHLGVRSPWCDFVFELYGFDQIDPLTQETPFEVIGRIKERIEQSEIFGNGKVQLIAKGDSITLSAKDGTTGSWTFRAIKDVNDGKKYIQPDFYHARAPTDMLLDAFRAMLSPNISKEDLKKQIARFDFYWNQPGIFSRGQAGVSEWFMHAFAKLHGYNLAFSQAWRGMSKTSMSPDMYATSFLDVDMFVAEFGKNAELKKL